MKIEYSILINRPVEEVFAYVSNVENWPQWISGASEARQTSPGSMGVGTTFTQVSHYLGRQFEVNAKVTEYELNRKFAVENDGKPVPYGNTITLERAGSSTRLYDVLKASGDVGSLFKLAEPIMERMFRRQFEKDHETLKDLLEAHAEARV
jgi:carbon monoxide dehydrogenase subunit G